MFEVELKVAADHETVRGELEACGARHLETVTQTDVYYSIPSRDFARTDEALRLRREKRDGDTLAAVTYKGPKLDAASKTRVEYETAIESVGVMEAILEAIDCTPAATVSKERRRFEIDGYVVSLDSVDGLGDFVEIEGETEIEGEIDRIRDRCRSILESISIDPDEQIRQSYLELLEGRNDASE